MTEHADEFQDALDPLDYTLWREAQRSRARVVRARRDEAEMDRRGTQFLLNCLRTGTCNSLLP